MRSTMISTGRDHGSIARFLVYPAMLLLLYVAGCGGGSGGGSGSNQPTNPPATLQVGPTTISVNAAPGASAPTAQVQAEIISSSSQDFYLQGLYTDHGLSSLTESVANGIVTLTLTFQDP